MYVFGGSIRNSKILFYGHSSEPNINREFPTRDPNQMKNNEYGIAEKSNIKDQLKWKINIIHSRNVEVLVANDFCD